MLVIKLRSILAEIEELLDWLEDENACLRAMLDAARTERDTALAQLAGRP
jgi:hypothetical protein